VSQQKPEYECLDEFNAIATKIIEKYPSVFADVNADEVRCYAITNKDKPDSKKTWTLRAVTYPIRLDCPYGWYATIYLEDWEQMNEKQQQLLVASILCAVGEEGKVVAPDLKDYNVMVRSFGVDYLDDTNVPDILNEDVDWVIR